MSENDARSLDQQATEEIAGGWAEQTAHFLAGSALQVWQNKFLGVHQ